MKIISILTILAECKGEPVTSRYIVELLVKLPEIEANRKTYEEFGWDNDRVIAQVIRDHSKDVYVALQHLKKSGHIDSKPIKKGDKRYVATDQKMLYTITKTGIKEIEKNRPK